MTEDAIFNAPPASELTIAIDPEPSTFRLALIGIFIVGILLGYLLIDTISQTGTCSPLAIFGGITFGVVAMYTAEKLLKPRWKSNRFVQLSPTAIRILHKETPQREIDTALPVNVLQWHFQTQQRSRIPKGWYVVALALEQDDLYLPVYTLVSPEDFAKMDSASFTRLTGRKEMKKMHQDSDLRRAGVQRRLGTAEYARSVEGAEMLPDDFAVYLGWLDTNFPHWFEEQLKQKNN